MNKETLENLLKDCVSKVNESERALKRLDDFCETNWGTTFHEVQSDMEVKGDHIVEWLNYGNGSADVEAFIKFMDENTIEADGQ